jgi:protein-L-isoaspartate O-methyltransferase
MGTLKELRHRCVARQIEARGVDDPLVLDAMRSLPRELFVPDEVDQVLQSMKVEIPTVAPHQPQVSLEG